MPFDVVEARDQCDCGPVDVGFGVLRQAFAVTDVASRPQCPGVGPLDGPIVWGDDEALVFGPRDGQGDAELGGLPVYSVTLPRRREGDHGRTDGTPGAPFGL